MISYLKLLFKKKEQCWHCKKYYEVKTPSELEENNERLRKQNSNYIGEIRELKTLIDGEVSEKIRQLEYEKERELRELRNEKINVRHEFTKALDTLLEENYKLTRLLSKGLESE